MTEGGSPNPASPDPPARPARKRRSFLRDGLTVLSGNAAHITFIILTGIVTFRVWGAAARGQIAIAEAVTDVAKTMGDLGMKKLLPSMIGRDEMPIPRIVGLAMTLWLSTSFLFAIAAAAYFLIPGVQDKVPWWWGALAATAIPLHLFMSYARGFALGFEDIGFIAKIYWLRDPVTLGLVVLFGVVLGFGDPEDAWLRIIVPPLSYIIVTYYCFRLITRYAKFSLAWDPRVLWSMLKNGFYFALGGLFMRMNYNLDKLILGWAMFSVPAADIGNYSIGVALANLLWQIPIALGYIVTSRSATSTNPLATARQTARVVRVGFAIATPAAVGLIVFAPWALPLVYGPEAVNAHHCTRIIVPGVLAFYAARIFESDLIGRGKPWPINLVMGPVVVANVVLNIIFIPRTDYWGGINGAALASTLTYTAGAVGMTLIYSRITGLPLREIVTPTRKDFAFRMPKKLSKLMNRTDIDET